MSKLIVCVDASGSGDLMAGMSASKQTLRFVQSSFANVNIVKAIFAQVSQSPKVDAQHNGMGKGHLDCFSNSG
jgi:hypothetical protein